MRVSLAISAALLGAAALGGTAEAANVCQAGKLTCATTMPVGGFCQCTAKGSTEDGTVVTRQPRGKPSNATAGGCGTDPRAPGCR